MTDQTWISKKFLCSMSAFTPLKYHHNQDTFLGFQYIWFKYCGSYCREFCNTSMHVRCENAKWSDKLPVFESEKYPHWCCATEACHKFFDRRANVLEIIPRQKFWWLPCKWYGDTFTNYLEDSGGVQCIMKIYTRNRHVYTRICTQIKLQMILLLLMQKKYFEIFHQWSCTSEDPPWERA